MTPFILALCMNAPPAVCVECQQATAAITQVKPAAPAVIPATVVVQPWAAGTHTVRVRLFERYRTGDGPVRRLFSGRFRGGC